MNPVLAPANNRVPAEATEGVVFGYEQLLRVAAATVARARTREIGATRVVGVVARDDVPLLEALVARLKQEFHVDATLRNYGNSFSVRFCRST